MTTATYNATLDQRALYNNEQGAICCAQHAPFVGTDTWLSGRWAKVPTADLVEWLTYGMGQMKCEVCGQTDGR
jgi:hypothetical protein